MFKIKIYFHVKIIMLILIACLVLNGCSKKEDELLEAKSMIFVLEDIEEISIENPENNQNTETFYLINGYEYFDEQLNNFSIEVLDKNIWNLVEKGEVYNIYIQHFKGKTYPVLIDIEPVTPGFDKE